MERTLWNVLKCGLPVHYKCIVTCCSLVLYQIQLVPPCPPFFLPTPAPQTSRVHNCSWPHAFNDSSSIWISDRLQTFLTDFVQLGISFTISQTVLPPRPELYTLQISLPSCTCTHKHVYTYTHQKVYLHHRLWNTGSPSLLLSVQSDKC